MYFFVNASPPKGLNIATSSFADALVSSKVGICDGLPSTKSTSNGLGGESFTRNRTYRRTDFGTKLIYPFFSKEKSGYKKYQPDFSFWKSCFSRAMLSSSISEHQFPFNLCLPNLTD